MGTICSSCGNTSAVVPEVHTNSENISHGSFEGDFDSGGIQIRKSSNASQITHFSDELVRSDGNGPKGLDVKSPRDGAIVEDSDEDEGFLDEFNFADTEGEPREVRASVGPLPNDRRLSTSTQEAVFIYQASARAAGKIHDEHIKTHQTEALPVASVDRSQWKKKSKGSYLPPMDDISAVSIVEEDMRNKSRMGRQSLQIQPQPIPRFITEYREKKERDRKTHGGQFVLIEETDDISSGDVTLTERPDSAKSRQSTTSSRKRKSL